MGKEMVKIVDNSLKHPEERQYLICLTFKPGSGVEDIWEIAIGRSAAYEAIKNYVELNIDYDHSFILVETCTLNQRKSIYSFMKYAGDFFEDSFDIDDYVKGDWDEEDFKRTNDINLEVDRNDRVNMASFLDGNVDMSDISNGGENNG